MDTRRELLRDSLLAATAFRQSASAQTRPRLGLPGLYPGRVVAVSHPASIVSGAYQARNVAEMMRKGMMELTGAPGSKANKFNRFSFPQVEHIELAGILGLGEFDDAKIGVKRFDLKA